MQDVDATQFPRLHGWAQGEVNAPSLEEAMEHIVRNTTLPSEGTAMPLLCLSSDGFEFAERTAEDFRSWLNDKSARYFLTQESLNE